MLLQVTPYRAVYLSTHKQHASEAAKIAGTRSWLGRYLLWPITKCLALAEEVVSSMRDLQDLSPEDSIRETGK